MKGVSKMENTGDNKGEINFNVWNSAEMPEKYSLYTLRREERYLFPKYFSPKTSVLDLACGAGRTTVRLHEMGCEVKGIDISDVLIKTAQTRFPYLSFETGSYCDLNEKDGSYDNILISFNSLDYAYPEAEREKAVSECFRVLKKGGFFIMSSHNIKALNLLSLPLTSHKWFLLKNSFNTLLQRKYIYEPFVGTWTFFGSPKYIIDQIEKHGFTFREMTGVRPSLNQTLNKYFSPHLTYVFIKD
jgi:ubiquinone/menaquinone biosynthesis C-methylase UbiE